LKTATPKKILSPKQNMRIKDVFCFARGWLTVCVTCVWAGVDSVWEQEKLEARKMLENAADSHTSGARFVGLLVRMCIITLVQL
jgi:hypothetical protein